MANAHQIKNEQALELHNKTYFAVGPQVSSKLPDVAPVFNSEKVGSSIVEFIGTIPGVETKNMLEVVSQPKSIALSDRAVSACLRRRKGGGVGMNLTFAYEGWPKHKLQFERTGPNEALIEVSLDIGPDSAPLGGKFEVGTITSGQFVHIDHSVQFDSDGIVLKDSPEYNLRAGEKLNIIKVIKEITTASNLGNPIDAGVVIEKARHPKLATVS